MAFSLRLSPDLLPVEAGATTPLALTVASRGEQAEQIEIQVEGVDPEWLAIPEPMFTVEPSEDHTERIFFKPARISESLAGNYPFVLRARSLDSGESKTAAGVLQIKPFNHLTMEIGPKKGYYSKYRKANTFQVTVSNLGNTEHTVQLFGNDPEDECAFDFEQETFVLGPGQSRVVDASVTPKTERTFSGSRLYGFSVSARSTNSPNVVTSAQAQLEQRPMLSAGTLAAAIFALIVIVAWLALLPKPPNVTLTVNPSSDVTQGSAVHISWESNTRVQVKVSGSVWQDEVPSNAAGMDYIASAAGPLVIEAIPYRDQKLDPTHEKTHTVNVVAPPVIPEPQIVEFDSSDKTVNVGESVILHYKLGPSVTQAKLAPTQQSLDLNATEIQVTPPKLGDNDYTIVAYNSAGKSVTQTLTVKVQEKIQVSIDSFDISPTGDVRQGDSVTVAWRVSKAAKVELFVNGQSTEVPAEGNKVLAITSTTTVGIVASDDKKRSVKKYKRINVISTVPPPDSTPTPPPSVGGANAGGQR